MTPLGIRELSLSLKSPYLSKQKSIFISQVSAVAGKVDLDIAISGLRQKLETMKNTVGTGATADQQQQDLEQMPKRDFQHVLKRFSSEHELQTKCWKLLLISCYTQEGH